MATSKSAGTKPASRRGSSAAKPLTKSKITSASPKLQVPVTADFKTAVDICSTITGQPVAHIGRTAYAEWLTANRKAVEAQLKAQGIAWPVE